MCMCACRRMEVIDGVSTAAWNLKWRMAVLVYVAGIAAWTVDRELVQIAVEDLSQPHGNRKNNSNSNNKKNSNNNSSSNNNNRNNKSKNSDNKINDNNHSKSLHGRTPRMQVAAEHALL